MSILIVSNKPEQQAYLSALFAAQERECFGADDLIVAAEMLSDQAYEVVVFCVDGQVDVETSLLMLRRSAKDYLYVAVLGEDLTEDNAINAGANCLLPVDADAAGIADLLVCVSSLGGLTRLIGDESEDFPSAGGIIARSAFYQLYLSGIDRAGRYGEQSYVISIKIDNYAELYEIGGPYVSDYAGASLSQYLASLRRQSDIIGQIGRGAYALLLQRPANPQEPMAAVRRFADALSDSDEFVKDLTMPLKVHVSLIKIPSGVLLYDEVVVVSPVAVVAS